MLQTDIKSRIANIIAENKREQIAETVPVRFRECPYMVRKPKSPSAICSKCVGTSCQKLYDRGWDDDGFPLADGGRPRCGAKTRKGGKCKNPVITGKTKCKFHGGSSTGPKTVEGRKRISEAQKKRWQNSPRATTR